MKSSQYMTLHRRRILVALIAGLVLLLAAAPVAVAGMGKNDGAGAQPTDAASTISSGASVSVGAGVLGVRMLVVDSQDNVVAVWSNTANPGAQVVVREGSANGPEHELTAEVKCQYERLLEDLDWGRKGLVYGGLQNAD